MPDVAIIGMAGRFPGASTVAQFWENLCAGIESIRDVPEEELKESDLDDSIWQKDNFVRRAAFPDNVESFDARFFGFTPSEAALTDPQHRLLLECAHEALEDAGYDPARVSESIAVFAGCSLNTYLLTQVMASLKSVYSVDLVQLNLASSADFLATRISYKLGLKGVSHTVQCACSTSLVAVHLACQSLLTGQSDMALAGGAALNFHLRYGYPYVPGGMFSATGKCRAFDSDADGTVFGNGAGMAVLKRYEDATRDRDQIYAVVKGTAVNNDGAAKVGYTAPSVEGQSLAIAEAISNAGISPEDVGYIEAHGTGTPLGDPIEIEALSRAFRTSSGAAQRCLIGSVKTNIGHLDCAAGISGLIKVAQILRHGLIPPSLHFTTPNPHIAFEKTPFQVNGKLTAWPDARAGRVAAVSAFGVGGTNAHVILESADSEQPTRVRAGVNLLIHSALSEVALDRMISATHAYLLSHPEITLEDAAFTRAVGRRQLPWRHAEVITTAKCGTDGDIAATHRLSAGASATSPSIIFMFPGQGSQITLMGQEIYRAEPLFRDIFDTCLDLLSEYMNQDPRSLTQGKTNPDNEKLLHQTEYGQPLLFAFEYALARLWISWGVKPDLMIGHSLGEYVAATIGGTWKLEDALRVIALRGQLMQGTAQGAMLSVPFGSADASAFTSDAISLAAVNSSSQCVLSGPLPAIDGLDRSLQADGIHSRRLAVSRAFHSSLMNPILAKFRECLETVTLASPQIPWMSNLTGTPITAVQAIDPAYWVSHLRNTVRFHDNLLAAHVRPNAIFLEVGPQRVLQQLASRLPLSTKSQVALSSTASERSEYVSLLSTLGSLWVRGATIDWNSVYARKSVYRVSLPTYPFERQRCWVERQESTPAAGGDLSLQVESSEPSHNMRQISISLHNRPQLSNSFVPPSTPTQMQLVSILEPIFGITPLGIRDNFFALGADSLMAVTLVSRLNEHFGIQIAAVDLYEALDIASLATIVDELAAASVETTANSDSLPVVSSSSEVA